MYDLIIVHWRYLFELLFSVLACLGFLSPANRGALMTCAVVLWVLLGTPAGYVSARLYKSKKVMYKKKGLLTDNYLENEHGNYHLTNILHDGMSTLSTVQSSENKKFFNMFGFCTNLNHN